MRKRVRRWRELLRSLGSAVLDLLRAELAALGEELAASGRQLRRGSLLLALALAVAVAALWSLALLCFELLVLALPRWGAAAAIFVALALAALVLFLAGRRALARIESPQGLVARRAHDHMEWWQGLLGEAEGGRADEERD